MIRFDHIYKQYLDDEYALHDINTEISDGEFVFLIGPSGAGKTTLLKLLLHDSIPSKGNLIVDDWVINELPKNKVHILRRKIAMIFQDFKLLTDRTIFENVAIGLEILGKKTSEIEKDVDTILDLVGLLNKKKMFPVQLSAGELQRTSIARAIVGGPKILLADEPTGNLDPQTSWDILKILQEVNAIGTTVIMATHNAGIVNEMKKRTIALSHGKIVSDEARGRYKVMSNKKEHVADSGVKEEETKTAEVRHNENEHRKIHHDKGKD
jgi:cell division transport system ATP-binding protein